MCILVLQEDEETQGKEKERVMPGKLHLTFEEQEKERQEQQRKQAEEEARRRLQEERKAFEEAKMGMVHTLFECFSTLFGSYFIIQDISHTVSSCSSTIINNGVELLHHLHHCEVF